MFMHTFCLYMQGLFQGRGGRGAFVPPIKVFAPPQELVELMYILNFGHAYRDKSNSGLFELPPP